MPNQDVKFLQSDAIRRMFSAILAIYLFCVCTGTANFLLPVEVGP